MCIYREEGGGGERHLQGRERERERERETGKEGKIERNSARKWGRERARERETTHGPLLLSLEISL